MLLLSAIEGLDVNKGFLVGLAPKNPVFSSSKSGWDSFGIGIDEEILMDVQSFQLRV